MAAPSAPSPFQVCIDAALRGSRAMLTDVLTEVRQSLQRQADQAVMPDERKAWMEALSELARNQPILQDRFPKMLEDEVRQAVDGGGKRGGGGLSFGSLELMDGDQVQENVETARAQQAAADAVEGELAQLNSLICSAQGLPRVQLDRNPLRPEVYMRSLRRAMSETQAPSKVRMRWMQVFGQQMGPPLAKTYDQLSELLRSQGVAVASFRVITQPSPSASRPSAGPSAATGPSAGGAAQAQAPATRAAFGFDIDSAVSAARTEIVNRPDFAETAPSPDGLPSLDLPPILGDESFPAPATAPEGDNKVLTLARLHDLLSGELATPAAPADAPATGSARARSGAEAPDAPADFSATMPAAFEALEEMGAVEDMVQRVTFRSFQIGDDADKPAGAGPVQAQTPAQALALEVVGVILEQLQSDERLLPPVRAAIDELRPALMRLALVDPRFFSDKKHPARVLVESIAQQSLAWTNETDGGFRAYLSIVRSTVQLVSDSKVEGVEPFIFALETFDAAIREQGMRDRRKRESAARAMTHLTQRQRLADEIGDDLARRAQQAGVPRTIGLFLKGPWAHVIAEARMLGAASRRDPAAYEEVVTDLLWSTKVSTAATQTARLARVVPGLTSLLREGLQSIRYTPRKMEEFLKTLGDLHQAALLAAATSRSPEEAARAIEEAPVYDGIWMEESGLMNLDFDDTAPPTEVAGLFENTAPQPLDDVEGSHADLGELAASLVPGAWIECRIEGQTLRLRCQGPSAADGMAYGFTTSDGVDHTISAAQLALLHARGDLSVVSDRGMIDGALDAVAEMALRNSARSAT